MQVSEKTYVTSKIDYVTIYLKIFDCREQVTSKRKKKFSESSQVTSNRRERERERERGRERETERERERINRCK